MIDTQWINEVAAKVSEKLPPALKVGKDDIEHNLKAALQATFAKLDLVTREEFDRQIALLQKSQQALKDLQQRMDSLEDETKSQG